MTEKAKKYLEDIINSIDLISDFVAGISDFNEFNKDLKTRSAVERQLSIIGEAVNGFDKIMGSDNTLENARKIVGFRNRLIHAYDSIDTSIVWAIIKLNLAPLKEEVLEKLG